MRNVTGSPGKERDTQADPKATCDVLAWRVGISMARGARGHLLVPRKGSLLVKGRRVGWIFLGSSSPIKIEKEREKSTSFYNPLGEKVKPHLPTGGLCPIDSFESQIV